METTAGEERVRAVQTLCRLEDAGVLLKQASTSVPVAELSPDFPKEVSAILNELTTLSSRDDAERLLATGVSMWNSVINLEALSNASQTEALVKVRHVAADCIYMAITVLSGVSAQYNIDEITLMKFYTTCGQKYVSELEDVDMAALCFAKAAEFSKSAEAVAAETHGGKRALAKALFDLAIGSAECAWERHEAAKAEKLVSDASQYLQDLPGECEYLASVQFNFGLFAYRSKDYERALVWLRQSIGTRSLPCNPVMNTSKQARALRLAGFCSLSLKDYERALETLQDAETMCHDPLGAYLLLKLFVITRSPNVGSVLKQIIEDINADLELCMGSLALLAEAQMLEEAKVGYLDLCARFQDDPSARACTIGPRYFDVLCSLNDIEGAVAILQDSAAAIASLASAELESNDIMSKERNGTTLQRRKIHEFNKWTNLVLHAATVFLDQKDYNSAATFVEHSLLLADRVRILYQNELAYTNSSEPEKKRLGTGNDVGNVVLENEAHVWRLSAACALCALSLAELSFPLSNPEKLTAANSALLRQASNSAARAKEMEPEDLAARLLMFRVFLMKGETARAAIEMERAATEVHEFDVGALAEAACEAKDLGSTKSVLAVLRCILQAHTGTEERSSVEPLVDGFVGSALVSAISMHIEQESPETTCDGNEANIPKLRSYRQDEADALLETLRTGLRALSSVGVLKAFGDRSKADSALSYLSDVAWNLGCQAKVEDCHEHMADFFELCYAYCSHRSETSDILRYRRSAKLLSSAAYLEESKGGSEEFEKNVGLASENLAIVHRLTADIERHVSNEGLDAALADDALIASTLPILDAQCHAARGDVGGIAGTVQAAVASGKVEARVLELLARIAFDMTGDRVQSPEERSIRHETIAAALNGALTLRLNVENIDIAICAATVRELLNFELSSIVGHNRALHVLERGIGLLKENPDYPADEQRWMTSRAWETSQMYFKTGRNAEAREWAEKAVACAQGNLALETYIPRFEKFLSALT